MPVVEVGVKAGEKDVQGLAVKKRLEEDLGVRALEGVDCFDYYRLGDPFTREDAETLGKALFADTINQRYSVDESLGRGDWIVCVEVKPGVTDNAGHAAAEGAADVLGREVARDSIRAGRKYVLRGSLERETVERICRDALANEIVENYFIGEGKP